MSTKTKRALGASASKYKMEDVLKGGSASVNGSKAKPPLDLRTKKQVQGLTPNQKTYIKNIVNSDIVFCLGDPGSGKSHIAVGMAANYLSEGKVDKIIVVRPAISCDEDLGFLPGGLEDKLGPYLRPIFDELFDFFTSEQIDTFTKGKYPIIEGASLGMLKGRTFKNAFVILDEGQDATYKQLKTFLTRMGEGTKMVITGDPNQSDLFGGLTDLERIQDKIKDAKVDYVSFSKMGPGDIQRHPRLAKLLEAI